MWDNKGEAFNWLDAAPFKPEIWGLFRLWPRLATNLNDLENLSDQILHYTKGNRMMDKSSGQSKYDDNSAYSKLKRLDTEFTTWILNLR